MRNDLVKKGLVLGIIVLFVGAGFLPCVNANTNSFQLQEPKKEIGKLDEINRYGNKDITPLFYRDVWFFFGKITNVTVANGTYEFEAVKLFHLWYFRYGLSDILLLIGFSNNMYFSFYDSKFIGRLTDDFICGVMVFWFWGE